MKSLFKSIDNYSVEESDRVELSIRELSQEETLELIKDNFKLVHSFLYESSNSEDSSNRIIDDRYGSSLNRRFRNMDTSAFRDFLSANFSVSIDRKMNDILLDPPSVYRNLKQDTGFNYNSLEQELIYISLEMFIFDMNNLNKKDFIRKTNMTKIKFSEFEKNNITSKIQSIL